MRCGRRAVKVGLRPSAPLAHFVHGSWLTRVSPAPPPLQQLPEEAPVLILLPGLTGGSEDTYVQVSKGGVCRRGRAVPGSGSFSAGGD